jgi:hypothetical protein
MDIFPLFFLNFFVQSSEFPVVLLYLPCNPAAPFQVVLRLPLYTEATHSMFQFLVPFFIPCRIYFDPFDISEIVIQGFLTVYVLTGMRLSASCPNPQPGGSGCPLWCGLSLLIHSISPRLSSKVS